MDNTQGHDISIRVVLHLGNTPAENLIRKLCKTIKGYFETGDCTVDRKNALITLTRNVKQTVVGLGSLLQADMRLRKVGRIVFGTLSIDSSVDLAFDSTLSLQIAANLICIVAKFLRDNPPVEKPCGKVNLGLSTFLVPSAVEAIADFK